MIFEHVFNEIFDCAGYGCPGALWELDFTFDIVLSFKRKLRTQTIKHKTGALYIWKQNKLEMQNEIKSFTVINCVKLQFMYLVQCS